MEDAKEESITECTREIDTRKALGAPNSSIRLQFIVESIVICMIGGIIGIALGVALVSDLRFFWEPLQNLRLPVLYYRGVAI